MFMPGLHMPSDPLPEPPVDVQDDNDIYRGERPLPHRSSTPESKASSSGSSLVGGRLGAIAAVVELAISRWARGTSPSSSRSSSPSSSRSSIVTISRSQIVRRRRRQPTTENVRTTPSEQNITARIKARQESRQVPREFVLYLPPSLTSGTPPSSRGTTAAVTEGNSQADPERVFQTTSLPSVLDHLGAALKKFMRAQRHQDRGRLHKGFIDPIHHPEPPLTHHDYMLPNYVKAPSRAASFTDLRPFWKERKGKQKEADSEPRCTMSKVLSPRYAEEPRKAQKGWWLDVASPSWEDMRAIGKLLHLHPLTLEDILHQDPREKLELFPRLGYYFIVFRAVEGRTTQGRVLRSNYKEYQLNNNADDEGVIDEANVYLVVFREGICSFHFSDISEHTNRVRNRVLSLEESVNMSSDWIAHGILDSVVDSFIPFLEEIEKEVLAVENIIFSDSYVVNNTDTQLCGSTTISDRIYPHIEEILDKEKIGSPTNEKQGVPLERVNSVVTRLSLPPPTSLRHLRRFKRFARTAWISALHAIQIPAPPPISTTAGTLRRMARTRRLVTSLTRLLATKSEVVTQIRKRLLTTSESRLGSGGDKGEEMEVAIYMGDVHDHILTLQHSLVHYERVLSQSHPSYLSQLRTTVAKTKSGLDKAVMMLSISSMGVLCIQTLIGLFSMNVTIPTNGHSPNSPYILFGVVIGMAILIICAYLTRVRWWWVQARRRRNTVL